MMVLYSGTTDPYSHRCRFVLFEKGMDFEIRDVDLFAKPEDIALMNPYNEVPILVERDLILYESHIINEYIDERFPHPQLMPGDPVARARVRLFLFNFEKELFAHVNLLEGRGGLKATDRQLERARSSIRERLTQLAPIFLKNKYMLGDDFSMLDVAIAPLLWRLDYYGIDLSKNAAPLLKYAERIFSRPAYIEALTPSEKVMRKCTGPGRADDRARRHRRPGQLDPPVPDPRAARLVHRQRLHALHRGLCRRTRPGAARVRQEQRDRAQHRLRRLQRS